MTNEIATIKPDVGRELIKQIAMDVGKEVAAHIEHAYPNVVKNAPSTFLLSVRNCAYGEIMAAVEVSDEGKIIARLDRNERMRKHMRKMRKLSASASPKNKAETMQKLAKLEKEFQEIMKL